MSSNKHHPTSPEHSRKPPSANSNTSPPNGTDNTRLVASCPPTAKGGANPLISKPLAKPVRTQNTTPSCHAGASTTASGRNQSPVIGLPSPAKPIETYVHKGRGDNPTATAAVGAQKPKPTPKPPTNPRPSHVRGSQAKS